MTELKSGSKRNRISDEVNKLIIQQTSEWNLALKNYAGLQKIETKAFQFDGFQIVAQHNPERIRSSAANVDAKSISKRPCFLCEVNRPEEQAAIDFHGKYSILINPFPIFEKHLTVSLNEHVPQEIEPYFSDMLELSKELADFTIFYNGPSSGASAPDHFHFQAVGKNKLPVEKEWGHLPESIRIKVIEHEQIVVQAIGGCYLRKLLVFSSSSKTILENYFHKTLSILKEREQEGEPMMNLLVRFENNEWVVFLFPRDLQRPSQFFAGGDAQILMSPATVEMSGLAILPLEKDFERITKEDLIDIFKQVSINDQDFKELIVKLKK